MQVNDLHSDVTNRQRHTSRRADQSARYEDEAMGWGDGYWSSRMLSSISRQVDDLRIQVEQHGRRLDDIQSLETQREDGGTAQARNGGSRAVLDRLQGQLKQNTFKLNSLQSQIDRHEAQLAQLRNDSFQTRDFHGQGVPQISVPTMDNFSQEYNLSRIATPMGLTTDAEVADVASTLLAKSPCFRESSPFSFFDQVQGLGLNFPSQDHTTTPNPIGSPIQPQLDPLPTGPSLMDLDVAELEKDNSVFTVHYSTPRETELRNKVDGILTDKLETCKRRIQELEAQLHNKDRVIRNLVESQEDIINKEKEYIHKQDWWVTKRQFLCNLAHPAEGQIGLCYRSASVVSPPVSLSVCLCPSTILANRFFWLLPHFSMGFNFD